MVEKLLIGLGVALAIEGIAYAAAPGLMKRMMTDVLGAPEARLRLAGLAAAFAGLAIVWAAGR